MDPMDFIRAHPPFDRLSPGELARVEEALETIYVAEAEHVLDRGGRPSSWLHMIRKGSILLSREGQGLQLLEAGDVFGYPSMLSRSSPTADAVAEEDTLLYRIPDAVFRKLMENAAFAEFFVLGLAGRLKSAASRDPAPLAGGLTAPVGSLISRPAVFADAQATVAEAARVMREARISSVLVRCETLGILTDRDFRSRVLAEGRGPETRVCDVTSRPVRTLEARASLLEALLFMLAHRVHHIPIEKDGRIEGVVTDTDLLRHQVKTPLYLLTRVERVEDPAVLREYGAELAGMVEALFWGGTEVAQIARIVSTLNDALVVRLLRQAEATLGPPPCPYAWIVFGSEGRMEQAILTDQDNALVFRDDEPGARDYFPRIADRVVAGLIEAGFPACKGGFMATSWCRPLVAWVRTFREWTEAPTPRHLVEVANFFDFRSVHGQLDLEPIESVLRDSSERTVFLAQLARAAVELPPPLGLFRRIREDEGGVDLKMGGILPIVALARVFGLETRTRARGTLDRLAAAVAHGLLSRETEEILAEAFRFLLRLRLRVQLKRVRGNGTAGNRAPLEELSALERQHLKDSFLAIREAQMASSLRYQVDRLG